MGAFEAVGLAGAVVSQVEAEDVVVGVGGFTGEGAKPKVVDLKGAVVSEDGVEIAGAEPMKNGKGAVGVEVVEQLVALGDGVEGEGHLVKQGVLGEEVGVARIDHPVPKNVVEDGGRQEEPTMGNVL